MRICAAQVLFVRGFEISDRLIYFGFLSLPAIWASRPFVSRAPHGACFERSLQFGFHLL